MEIFKISSSSPPSLNVQKVHEEFIQNIETGIPHPGTSSWRLKFVVVKMYLKIVTRLGYIVKAYCG